MLVIDDVVFVVVLFVCTHVLAKSKLYNMTCL